MTTRHWKRTAMFINHKTPSPAIPHQSINCFNWKLFSGPPDINRLLVSNPAPAAKCPKGLRSQFHIKKYTVENTVDKFICIYIFVNKGKRLENF